MIAFLLHTGWPAAVVIIVALIGLVFLVCFIRANSVNRAVRDAVDHERSKQNTRGQRQLTDGGD